MHTKCHMRYDGDFQLHFTAVLSTFSLSFKQIFLRVKYPLDHSDPKCFFQPSKVLNQPWKLILLSLTFLQNGIFS